MSNENWVQYYKEHLLSMDDAVKEIHSGDNIWFGQAIAIPYNFLNKLYERKDELENVGIFYNFSASMIDMLFDPDSKSHFNVMPIFLGPVERMCEDTRVVRPNSNSYDQIVGGLISVYGANTIVIEVCPPDENGCCNTSVLGAPTNGYMNADPRITKRIAIVNKHSYPAQGNYEKLNIPVTQFDFFVEDNHEAPIIPVSAPSEHDKTIAGFVMDYIHDGDTVQIGMGGLGEQITKELCTKKDIKIFSEITVDSMVPLAESGVVTKVTTCGAFGTELVYNFVSKSDIVTTKDLTEMLDPMYIGMQDNLVAINSTFMCDLLGQCCSEAQGLRQYSGVGGAFSFQYGAIRSHGGRSFTCLRSTYKDKTGAIRSNIVPWLDKCIITCPKYLTMFVVSEYGVADVYLKSNIDRINALIKIAHPDFRSWLKEEILTTGLIVEEELGEN